METVAPGMYAVVTEATPVKPNNGFESPAEPGKLGPKVVPPISKSTSDDQEGPVGTKSAEKEMSSTTSVSYTHLTLPTTPYV